jgi:hypothetical protein
MQCRRGLDFFQRQGTDVASLLARALRRCCGRAGAGPRPPTWDAVHDGRKRADAIKWLHQTDMEPGIRCSDPPGDAQRLPFANSTVHFLREKALFINQS